MGKNLRYTDCKEGIAGRKGVKQKSGELVEKSGESIEKWGKSIEKNPIHARINRETSETIEKCGTSNKKCRHHPSRCAVVLSGPDRGRNQHPVSADRIIHLENLLLRALTRIRNRE